MAEETPQGTGGGMSGAAGAAGAAALALAGYFGWGVYQKSMTPTANTEVSVDDAPVSAAAEAQVTDEAEITTDAEVATAATAEPISDTATTLVDEASAAVTDAATADPVEEAPVVMNAPIFDVVRIDPDGNALVAGEAEPGQLEILLEGEAIAQTLVDDSGKFVALFDVTPSDLPRVMSLRSTTASDVTTLSEQSVIVEPFTAPIAVASADTPVGGGQATDLDDTEVAQDEPEDKVEEAVEAATLVAQSDAPTDSEDTTSRMVVADGDSIRVLAATAPGSVRIDTVSYGSEGEVLLAGQGTKAGATVRLYVNNDPLVTAKIAPDFTWNTVLPDVDSGLYVLRVDQLSDQGQVTSRAQIPFQREDIAVVIASQTAAEQAVTVATSDTVDATVGATVGGRVDVPVAPVSEAAQDVTVAAVDASTTDVPSTQTVTNLASGGDVVALSSDAASENIADVVLVGDDPAPDASSTDSETTLTVASAASETAQANTPSRPKVVTVQPGFTLWGIATDNLGDGMLFVHLYEANKDQIRDPNLIYPGQVLAVPGQ
ncbi:LysM peptidoglycan-binding domain-containing protein [Halocynthiibacter namhaensis]|uniref:LysM peptidoglycan-binding domain-containing protein n=1 Tax=Halocynthiibacter namhaensis TaxID=1290553 RepID=UPI00057941B7|nr:LysM peptidoglycan-binding domain-containing protein [Halocynthiibacter namhaensis]